MISKTTLYRLTARTRLWQARRLRVAALALAVCFLPVRALAGDSGGGAAVNSKPFTLSCDALMKSRNLPDWQYGFTASFFVTDSSLFFWQGKDDQTQTWLPLIKATDQYLVFGNVGFNIQINRFSGQLYVKMVGDDDSGWGGCSKIDYRPPPARKF